MGSMARVNVAAIPIPGVAADAREPAVSSMTLPPEPSSSPTPDAAAPLEDRPVVAEPETVPTISLREVAQGLLKQITRERMITAGLACISIGALFLIWYLGTRYRF
jgi:NitT/TauT family transport system permease protein